MPRSGEGEVNVDALRQERIRSATEELQVVRAEIMDRERELKRHPLWIRICELRDLEWRLVRIAAGLLDAAEHGDGAHPVPPSGTGSGR